MQTVRQHQSEVYMAIIINLLNSIAHIQSEPNCHIENLVEQRGLSFPKVAY
jgi:hypothetical protein